MAYPVIGQNIQLEILDGQYVGRYNARVQDMEKTKIFIDLPLKSEATVPTLLPDGLSVTVRYRAVDGAMCSFVSRIGGRAVRQIELLSLVKPMFSEIHRQQRREFLRVPILVTMDLVYMESITKSIITAKADGIDISGGGLSFRVNAELPVQANDIIGFRFMLPLDGKGHEIVGKARVIRAAAPCENGKKVISLKYFEINENDRQRIVQYSFKRQIEMREKGILN